MSASQIPNLLSLRGKGGLGRRGGRGGLAKPEVSDPEAASKQQDKIVQATDTDANISRLSAVQIGYLQDPFATEFVPVSASSGPPRRLPIINRGSYARTIAVDKLVQESLTGNGQQESQIISLGAGSDTRFFRLELAGLLKNCVYHELDFSDNTQTKIAAIRKSERIASLWQSDDKPKFTENEIHSARYHLHAIDLRHLDPSHPQHQSRSRLSQIRADLPTLIISECCLTYLKPEAADAVLAYLTTQVLQETTPRGLVLYEPINPFDSFGKVMVSNLAARGIVLQTLHKYSSLDAQIARMKMYGFISGQRAVDVAFVHSHWIDDAEKERISRLEMLDEVEELNMLMKHYCVVWAWNDGTNPGIWSEWQKIRSQIS